MSDAPELLPCPFCGGAAYNAPPYRNVAICDVCFARGPLGTSPEAAIAAWNTRTDLHTAALAERDARIAALEAGLRECVDDLEVYVDAEYPIQMRDNYPTLEAKYARDMEPVIRARARLDGGKP